MMLGPAQRIAVSREKAGEKERGRASPAPRRKPEWNGTQQELTRSSPEEMQRRKEMATSVHLAEAREEVAARLNPLAAMDSEDEFYDEIAEETVLSHSSARHFAVPVGSGGLGSSRVELEVSQALEELGRAQAQLRSMAPHRKDADGTVDVDAEAAAFRQSARGATPGGGARSKSMLFGADAGGAFDTPGAGAGSRARRAAAHAASNSPRGDAHGRAPPGVLGLNRIEHAAASLAEKVREFEAANGSGSKPTWRSPGTPGGISGQAGFARPRTAGARSQGAGAGAGSGTFGGYTEMLVEMATKLIGYLNEAESRLKAEEAARTKVTTDFEKRLTALEATTSAAQQAAAKAQKELEAVRESHGATLDALVGKVAVLERASGHAHVTTLLAALQSGHPVQPAQPPTQPSAAVTPVRATTWGCSSSAQPRAAAHEGGAIEVPPAFRLPTVPYVSAAVPTLAVAAHRALSPGPLAPATHCGDAGGAGSQFSGWPHATQGAAIDAAAAGQDSCVPTQRGWSPARSLGGSEHDAPPQLPPPATTGPAPTPMSRLILLQAEGALLRPRAGPPASKQPSAPIRALRDSTNGGAPRVPSVPTVRVQNKTGLPSGRGAAHRDFGV